MGLDELYRQASRKQEKINLVTLVLFVMEGKASDVVGRALIKSKKKEQEETKELAKVKKSSGLRSQELLKWGFLLT